MRNLLLILVLSLFCLDFKSQQNHLFNQSLFNYYQLNSAYAGSKNTASLGLGLSKQWTSIEGAPFAQYVSFHAPLKENKIGFGLLLSNETIGAHSVSSVQGTFAYHLPVNKGIFSLGIDLGLEQTSFNFTELNFQQTDLVYPEQGVLNRMVPLFNFSSLYQTNRFIAGIKITNLFQSNYSLTELGMAREYTHADLILGIARRISKNLVWKPYLLINATSTQQFAFDLSSNFTLMDKVTFGASYRNDKNLNLISHFFVRKNIRIGYSYEISLINSSTNKPTSHELFMGINLGKEKGTIVSPRFYSL